MFVLGCFATDYGWRFRCITYIFNDYVQWESDKSVLGICDVSLGKFLERDYKDRLIAIGSDIADVIYFPDRDVEFYLGCEIKRR